MPTVLKPRPAAIAFFITGILFFCSSAAQPPADTLPASVPVTIDVLKTGAPISRLVYGQFIELLFNYFEGGLWSEMIGDRKFFYPLQEGAPPAPANTRHYLGQWQRAGAAGSISMDSLHVYTGEHSPRIALHPGHANGICQEGLMLAKNKTYAGYIIAAADKDATVIISLKDDQGKEQELAVLRRIGRQFRKLPFAFIAKSDSKQAMFSIKAKGNGSLLLGAVSLMPADNVHGFRADILARLKELHMHIIRWGGNASSGYDWRDGVGNRDKRPPRYDYAWNAMESNDVGTDEYLDLCRLLNVQPYIGVNAGFGDAHTAAAWVEYVNGNRFTPMGRWRAANGHAAPYGVKWWGIGNEMYGEWQLGRMDIRHFIIKHTLFAKAMRKVDPSIVLVASGASPYETAATSIYFRNRPAITAPYPYGSDEDWSGKLLAGAQGYYDYIAEHLYPISDSAYDVNRQDFVPVQDSALNRIRRLPNRIKGGVEAYHEYLKRMPFLKEKNKGIAMDEWHLKDGWGLEDALATAEAFHEIFRHSDIIRMAAYTSTSAPSCLLYNNVAAAIQPNGLVIKMYSNYFGSIPVQVQGIHAQEEVKGTKGVDKPFETSGSNTYPIDVSAALNAGRKKLAIALVNPAAARQKVLLQVKNATLPPEGLQWVLAGTDLKAVNMPGQAPAVSITASTYKNNGGETWLQPYSVTLLQFALQ